jgi:hypothetical protein
VRAARLTGDTRAAGSHYADLIKSVGRSRVSRLAASCRSRKSS